MAMGLSGAKLMALTDELMFRLREVQTFKRPSERDQGSVYQEMAAGASDIESSETHWITRSDDLAALAKDADHGWFNIFVEDALNCLSRGTLLVSTPLKDCHVPTFG